MLFSIIVTEHQGIRTTTAHIFDTVNEVTRNTLSIIEAICIVPWQHG